MSKKYQPLAFVLSSILVITPVLVYAQVGNRGNCPGTGNTLCTLINTIIGYLNQILFLMIGVAIVIFVWYIIQYFIKPDADRKEAGKYVMYSLIGFFVILSFWGLVNILQNTFGLKNESNQPASWTSFKGLFPGGGSSGPGNFGGSTGGPTSGNFGGSTGSPAGNFGGNTTPDNTTYDSGNSGTAPDNR